MITSFVTDGTQPQTGHSKCKGPKTEMKMNRSKTFRKWVHSYMAILFLKYNLQYQWLTRLCHPTHASQEPQDFPKTSKYRVHVSKDLPFYSNDYFQFA